MPTRDLSEHLADETPCGWCGHAAGWHDMEGGPCLHLNDNPDECLCVAWQEPI